MTKFNSVPCDMPAGLRFFWGPFVRVHEKRGKFLAAQRPSFFGIQHISRVDILAYSTKVVTFPFHENWIWNGSPQSIGFSVVKPKGWCPLEEGLYIWKAVSCYQCIYLKSR